MSERILSAAGRNEQEAKLRPQSFKEYIGQKRVVDNIEIMVKSSIQRNASMDHVLLSGPPGLGKPP
jgi:Holliday junction DNA helicase RuvB